MPGYSPPFSRNQAKAKSKNGSRNGARNGSRKGSTSTSKLPAPARQTRIQSAERYSPLTPILEEPSPRSDDDTSTAPHSTTSTSEMPPAVGRVSALVLSPTSTAETTPSPTTPFPPSQTQIQPQTQELASATIPEKGSDTDLEEASPSPDLNLIAQLAKFPMPPYRPATPAPSPPLVSRTTQDLHRKRTGLGIQFGGDSAPSTAAAPGRREAQVIEIPSAIEAEARSESKSSVSSSSTTTRTPGSPSATSILAQSATSRTSASAARIQVEPGSYPITPWRRAFEIRESLPSTDRSRDDQTTVDVQEVSSPESPMPGVPSGEVERSRIDFSASPESHHGSDVSSPATVVQTPMITLCPASTQHTPDPEHRTIFPSSEEFEPEPSPSTSPRNKGKQKATEIGHAITTTGAEEEDREGFWVPRPVVLFEGPGEASHSDSSERPSDRGSLEERPLTRTRGQALRMERAGPLRQRQPPLPDPFPRISLPGEGDQLPDPPRATSTNLLPAAELTAAPSQFSSTEVAPQTGLGLANEGMERTDSGGSEETVKPSSRIRPTSPISPPGSERTPRGSISGGHSPPSNPLPSDPPFDVSEWFDSPEEEENPFEYDDIESPPDEEQTLQIVREAKDQLRRDLEYLQDNIGELSTELPEGMLERVEYVEMLGHLASLAGLYRSSDHETNAFHDQLARLGRSVECLNPPSAEIWSSDDTYPFLGEMLSRIFQVILNEYDEEEIEGPITQESEAVFIPPDELWLFINTADLKILAVANQVLKILLEGYLGTTQGVILSLCLSRTNDERLEYKASHFDKYKWWSKKQRLFFRESEELMEYSMNASPEFIFDNLDAEEKFEACLKKVTWHEIDRMIQTDVMPAMLREMEIEEKEKILYE
ncbi:hypothetical protein I316_01455 [Kwoniella heveanensis BCC8398]|uniref:Uncharacterized protein n=1 Tax=Kwoniella heveanensis BCC8398 TaxID=1296120 RepID=A0A1B9H0Q0_9TREE|nr:hypothetical protein I316_01455 [Kwoniella heveanensis BCC8398]